jgi:TolA-binding protein
MKKFIAAITLILLLFVVHANAQPKILSKEQRVNDLTEKLKLNPAQVKKVQQILNASEDKEKKIDDKIKELHNDLKALRDNDDNQVMNILDKDQKEKFTKMKKDRDKKHPMEMGQRPPAPEGSCPPEKK